MRAPSRTSLSYAGTWSPEFDYEPGDVVKVPFMNMPLSFVTGEPTYLCLERAAAGAGAPGNPRNALWRGVYTIGIQPNGKWVSLGSGANASASATSVQQPPWRGEWARDVSYHAGDFVGSEGSAYIASRDVRAGQDRPGRWVRDDPWHIVVRSRLPVFHSLWDSKVAYNAWDIVQYKFKWWNPTSPDNPVLGVEPNSDHKEWQVILELPDPSSWKGSEISSLTVAVFAAAVGIINMGFNAAKVGPELARLGEGASKAVTENVNKTLNDLLTSDAEQALPGLERLRALVQQARDSAEAVQGSVDAVRSSFESAASSLR